MANEMQKMREAVVAISEAIKELRERNPKVVDCVRETIKDIENWTNYALAVRRRNCDVGTAEEQVARHHAYCYRMMEQNNHCCGPCPCYKFVNGEVQSCTLLWAQMPYEAEAGGAK